MSLTRPLGLLGLVGVAGVAAFVVGRSRFDRSIRRLADELERDVGPSSGATYSASDLSDLPAPVRRYLEHVLTEGQPAFDEAHLRWRGAFRLGDASSSWRPLAATEYVTMDPPGFVWDATIEMVSLVPVRVVDASVGGEGSLRAKAFSAVTVADAPPCRELDEAELARYLAEAVWYPTAFLPGRGVTWNAVDDHTAEATVERDGTTASVTFHFDEDDEIETMTADRWRQRDDGSYERCPWTGRFADYHERGGMLIPRRGTIEWNLPDGDLQYWRGTIESAAYHPER